MSTHHDFSDVTELQPAWPKSPPRRTFREQANSREAWQLRSYLWSAIAAVLVLLLVADRLGLIPGSIDVDAAVVAEQAARVEAKRTAEARP